MIFPTISLDGGGDGDGGVGDGSGGGSNDDVDDDGVGNVRNREGIGQRANCRGCFQYFRREKNIYMYIKKNPIEKIYSGNQFKYD